MRHRWTVSLLVLASATAAYAAQARTADKPVVDGLPFKVGDSLTLIYSPGQDRECRVEEIRGLFVKCDGDGRPGESWLNVGQATGFNKRR